MEKSQLITGIIAILIGIAILFSRQIVAIIVGIVLIIIGIVIFLSKENEIEKIKNTRNK